MAMQVRPARPEDRAAMLDLWERSVRATHDFLGEGDIVALRPLVAQGLASDAVGWWVLAPDAGAVAGFLGYTPGTIEALFIDPDRFGQGGGRRLVDHAQSLAADDGLDVDVNEQNAGAVRFYEHLGFVVTRRSPTDAGGRPFPILHMKRPAPGARSDR